MYKYIIYLDTKIMGALYQTIKYFKQGIFGKETLIVYKKYKEIDKKFQKELKKENINFQPFSQYKDIPSLDGKIIFYLFNAQSNCRIVANRNATHIFVTHGESNKISSVKPIIKIYDHVIVSGNLGIDRYLENKLFYADDLKRHKIIKMGTTFIGSANYNYNEQEKTILYAPTWEGGIVEENYSSINKNNNSFKVLDEYSKVNNIEQIIIQPHPNTGHRDKKFNLYLIKGIKYLLSLGYKVTIVNFNIHWFLKLKLKQTPNFSFSSDTFMVSKAFVDVSAMEVQLIANDIPTYVFFINLNNSMPLNSLLKNHYTKCGIYNFKLNKYDEIYKGIKDYYISYENHELKSVALNKRLEWLKKNLFIIKNKRKDL